MPDFTMCKGTDCPDKQQCYRYTAVPDEHQQSWSSIHKDRKQGEKCTMFMTAPNEKQAQVLQHNLDFMEVCVPENWTDLLVLDFAGKYSPCGSSKKRAIRKKETKEREPCLLNKGFVHIVLYA